MAGTICHNNEFSAYIYDAFTKARRVYNITVRFFLHNPDFLSVLYEIAATVVDLSFEQFRDLLNYLLVFVEAVYIFKEE